MKTNHFTTKIDLSNLTRGQASDLESILLDGFSAQQVAIRNAQSSARRWRAEKRAQPIGFEMHVASAEYELAHVISKARAARAYQAAAQRRRMMPLTKDEESMLALARAFDRNIDATTISGLLLGRVTLADLKAQHQERKAA